MWSQESSYLLRAIPLLPLPLLVQKELVVIIGHNSWRECPRTIETATIGMATTESMGTGQSNNFLVIEAHAVEDVPQVLVSLFCIWKPSIRCASSDVFIQSTRSVWDGRALHLLDTTYTSEDPEVGVGHPWELGCGRLLAHVCNLRLVERTLDWLEEVPSSDQTCICTVVTFWGESHGGTI